MVKVGKKAYFVVYFADIRDEAWRGKHMVYSGHFAVCHICARRGHLSTSQDKSLFAPELFSDDFLVEKSQEFMIIIIVTCFTPLPPILDAFSRHSFPFSTSQT